MCSPPETMILEVGITLGEPPKGFFIGGALGWWPVGCLKEETICGE
jgi:hypothetical protein